jgi:hypothetical protein
VLSTVPTATDKVYAITLNPGVLLQLDGATGSVLAQMALKSNGIYCSGIQFHKVFYLPDISSVGLYYSGNG